MRVLFLQRQPCIRALKYARALRGAGSEGSEGSDLTLGYAYQGRTLSAWYGTGDELFSGWWRLGPDADAGAGLRDVVAEFRPDLIHSHNLPDTLTVAALDLGTDLGPNWPPVIHDVHDMASLRHTPYEDGFDDPEDPLALERRALAGADALVLVSNEMLDALPPEQPLPARRLIFPNLASADDLPAALPPPERPRHGPLRLVYEGTLSDNGSHYDLREGFAAACAQGLEVHVYPNRDAPAYRELAARTPGLVMHERLRPSELMQALPAYDLGWVVLNDRLNRRHLDTALPNKAFEYLGAGLPLLSGEHRALARLVRERGLGLVVGSLDGLAERLADPSLLDLVDLRRQVAAVRHELTVEGAIDGLLGLYEAVLAERADRDAGALVPH